jgi:transcriptional regulator with XRE-family HTH domain
MSPRAAFGPRLRAHRERQGITLESIATHTKIKVSLLAGLERGDVSQWPRGIFRRAFVRDYAVAVGLAPEPLVHEFVQLFPEDGSAPEGSLPATPETTARPASLRLSLAADPRDHLRRAAIRAGSAAAEVAALLLVGSLIALVAGTSLLITAGVLALVYYPIVAAVTGRTLSPQQLWSSIRRLSNTAIEQVHDARRRRMRLVPRRSTPHGAQPQDDYSQERRTAAS